MLSRPKISEVFVPRSQSFNKKMYVDRPDLEKDLMRAIGGSLHVVIHGESGTGKSWLTQKVLSDNAKTTFQVVCNCANASRLGSLTSEIYYSVFKDGEKTLEGTKEVLHAKAKALVAEGGLEHTSEYHISESELLYRCYKKIRDLAGEKSAVLIVENLEAIFDDPELMKELANIIILLDDPRYAEFKIKLLIIGTPSSIKYYYARNPNLKTVGNRLQELPEIKGMSKRQVDSYVEKGFIDQLRAKIPELSLKYFQEHVYFVTLGNPRRVCEYCEQLAYVIEDSGWTGDMSHTDIADKKFLSYGLREALNVVEEGMNSISTDIGRKNQVLYCLGKLDKLEFSVQEVEEILRTEFPNSTKSKSIRVDLIIASLSKKLKNPILRRSSRASRYEFFDPRYLMCIRTALKKDSNERVENMEI